MVGQQQPPEKAALNYQVVILQTPQQLAKHLQQIVQIIQAPSFSIYIRG